MIKRLAALVMAVCITITILLAMGYKWPLFAVLAD